MATQTRKEHYDECVAKKLPVPELITKDTVVGSTQDGSKILAKEADHNDTDYREYDPKTGEAGPWQKAKK